MSWYSASVIEIQITWQSMGEGTDEGGGNSLERLLLLIQLVASKHKFCFRLFGKWPAFANLVIEIPHHASAIDFLAGPMSESFNLAGNCVP